MELTRRQQRIIEIVKEKGPITGEQIAEYLNLTRATLRPDLAILTMAGILEARPRVGYYYSGKGAPEVVAERVKSVKVGEIKSQPVVIRENLSVYDAIVTLFLENVGTLFVAYGNELLAGVVSRKDLLKTAIGQGDIHKIPVGMIMTRMPNIVTTTPEESAWEAARKIMAHEVDALPVVERAKVGEKEGFKVIGKVTKTNITRLFVELGEGRN